jgi:HK97 family phage prohead protease
MERKSFSLGEFKALGNDSQSGTFEALAAVFDNVDAGGDRIERGAFSRSLAEWKAKGRSVPVLWSHDVESVPIGVIKDARETSEGLRVKAHLFVDDHPQARAVHAAMRAGALHEFSFGYKTRDYEHKYEGGRRVRVLKDVHLGEVSPVFSGMNPETRVLSVKSAVETDLETQRDALDAEITATQLKILELSQQRDALNEAVASLAELPEETPPPNEAKPTAESTAEDEQEHEDKPEPNPTRIELGEEALARIRALQVAKPEHLETEQ